MAELGKTAWVPMAALLAAVVTLWPALPAPRYVDDFYLHARVAGTFAPPTTFGAYEFFASREQVRAQIESGMLPWWTDPELGIRFFRPLTSATHALDVRMLGADPVLARAHSLLWLAALLAAGWLLLRRWLAPKAAALASFVYAIGNHHALPAAWLAARHALVSGAFGLMAIYAWLRWREDGRRRYAWVWLGATLLALSGGEVGLGVLAICAAHSALARPERSLRERVVDASPALALGLVFLAGYAALGFGARGSAGYIHPVTAPIEFVSVAAGRWLAMIAQLCLGIPAEFYIAEVARPLLWVLGLLGMLALLLAWRGIGGAELRTRPAWLLVGALLALLPAGSAIPGGRALVLSALALSAIVAALIVRAFTLVRSRSRPNASALIAIAAIAFGQLVISPFGRVMLANGVRYGSEQERQIAAQWGAPCTPSQWRVMLAAPDFAAGAYTPLQLAIERGEPLERFRLVSMAPIDVVVARRGERRLSVQAAAGSAFFQSQWEQLHGSSAPVVGQGGANEGLAVRVSEADAEGRPTALEVETLDPVDAVCWLAWNGTTFERVRVPPLGKSLSIETRPGPLAVPGIER